MIQFPVIVTQPNSCHFSLIDFQILWRGQEKIMADAAAPEEWDKSAGIRVADSF